MNKNDDINSQPPPIPPRRKKRKNNLSTIVNSEPASKPSSKPRKKPRLPPPPPPPLQNAHEKRNQFVNNPQYVKKAEPDLENNEIKKGDSSLIPYEVKFNVSEKNKETEVLQNHFQNQFQNQKRNTCSYNPQSREPNRYPPLLFTFQDFQAVMAESISNNDYQTSLDETFSSNNLIDESKVCFRVTTTNLPFGKCLGTWQNSFDNPEFESCDENLFIFEDYIDRSKRTNARPDLFRMESLENSFEEVVPNRTKVRFVIESPSTSTPDDDDAEITTDSLQNIDSLNKDLEELQKIQSICEAIQISGECENGKISLDLLCTKDESNLIEVLSEADIICEEHLQIEENKAHVEISKDLSKTEEISSSVNKIISLDSETIITNETITINKIISEESFSEEETNIPASLPKLLRYKTCLSSDQFSIQDSTDIENNKEVSLEVPKVTSANFSKLQRSKTQNSGSCSYEDANDTEELVLEVDQNSESKKDRFLDEKKEIESLVKFGFENSSKDDISMGTNILNLRSSLELEDNLESEIFEANLEENLEMKLNNKINFNPSPQVSSVPVSVRRNSFLDKMLNEDTSCEVVATHPKPDELKQWKGTFLNTTKQEFPSLSMSSDKKVVKRSSGFDESRNEDQKMNILKKMEKKSVGEAKCDMLNELLCNFSAIKLKSVASSKNIDRDQSANHVNFVDKSACKQKTDELRVEENGSVSARVTDPSESLANLDDRLVSVDKCAIARRSPKTCNNSIDNNAKTPVALSIDQSQDAFSITPGSVRNFIKHYEFQQETSNQCFNDKDKDSKDKETDFKDRNEDCKNKDKVETAKLSMTNEQEILIQKEEVDQNSLNNLESYDTISRCKSLESIENSNQEFLKPYGTRGRRQSCIKSNDTSPISERKKSVQFDSACTVIQIQKPDESSMSSLINGIRSRIKGKAPNKPEMQMPITFKTTLRSDDSTPEVQKESEAQVTGNTSKTGTDHLVPKTENPRHNQTFVFYCKV